MYCSKGPPEMGWTKKKISSGSGSGRSSGVQRRGLFWKAVQLNVVVSSIIPVFVRSTHKRDAGDRVVFSGALKRFPTAAGSSLFPSTL